MTELTIPETVDAERARGLVVEFLDPGDVVEVRNREMTEDDAVAATGEVTGFETDEDGRGYLELDGRPVTEGSAYYRKIETVTKLEESEVT